jgi:hypothetical protein
MLIEAVELAIEQDFDRIPNYPPAEEHPTEFCGICKTYFGRVAGHYCDPRNSIPRFVAFSLMACIAL